MAGSDAKPVGVQFFGTFAVAILALWMMIAFTLRNSTINPVVKSEGLAGAP